MKQLMLAAEIQSRTDPRRRPDLAAPCPSNGQISTFGRFDVRLTLTPADTSGLSLLRLGVRRRSADLRPTFEYGWLRLSGLRLPPTVQSVLANGHNGWSYSPMLRVNEILHAETNPLQETFGDHDYYCYDETPGRSHSWSFAYADCGRDGIAFYGATDERHFHTVFEFDLNTGSLAIAIETAGFNFEHQASPAVDLEGFTTFGEWLIDAGLGSRPALHTAANLWIQQIMAVDPRRRPDLAREDIGQRLQILRPIRGYTSWYYRYTAIDAAWLMHNLEAVSQRPDWRVFQIDDGYQAAIGDWLTPKHGFPDGVAPILAAARAKGLTPGLWLAPFVATSGSTLFQAHPEWLQRQQDGALVLCGDFPHWNGKFYALDLEQQAVRAHLEDLIGTMCKDWGAGFLKTDFLYASARAAGGGLTRAARAARAHAWLFDLCREYQALLLSCGATISASLGLCHFSRIGADVGLSWQAASPEHHSREQVHTQASLVNTITRSFLNGLAFANDPDVMILRDQGTLMSLAERRTLLMVNQIFGDLIFTSDDLSEYGTWQREALTEAETLRNTVKSLGPITSIATPEPNSYVVRCMAGVAKICLNTENPSFRW